MDLLTEPAEMTVRGGLHVGTLVNVLIGTPSRRSFDVMGDVVNTAARAMALATWGEVVVTEAARKSLWEVETRPLGSHSMKGMSQVPVA